MGGASLFYSELARAIVTPAWCVLAYLAVGAAVTRRLAGTLWLAVAALVLTDIVVPSQALLDNSLMGLRSTMPLFFLAAFLAPLPRRVRPIACGMRSGPPCS